MSKLWFSAQVMIIGMLIVFFGLAILIGFIYLLSFVLNKAEGKKKAKQQAAAPAPAPVVVPKPVAEVAAAQTNASADELVAVITAALMAYTASSGIATAGKTLVVRNIRAARANAWAQNGRADQLNGRF